MFKKIQSRAFANAADTLGVDEPEALTSIETDGATAVLDLESFSSQNLTIEEYMIARATSAGAAGFEGFAYFDMDDITHPNNAWVMDITAITITGSPTAAAVTMGIGPAVAGSRLVVHWDATISPGIGGVTWLQDGLPTMPFPIPLSRQAATAIGTPSVLAGDSANPFQMEIDPAAIGNVVQYTTRVRSAPDGVRVWGTW